MKRAGAGMSAVVSFHSVCRLFSHHRWEADQLGVLLARLVVQRLVPADEPVLVAVDDTLFRRWGRKVHHAFWTHDGAAQGPAKLGRGNRWVVAGIVVRLPFCSHPVCLPVLFRLWAGEGTTSPVELAGQLLDLLADQFGDRRIDAVADAAYHGTALLVDGSTFTTRLPVNAVLYAPAPPRTGRRDRPALKGARLGTPAQLATAATWRTVTVARYGRTDTIEIAVIPSIWHGAFGNTAGRAVLVRDTGSDKGYQLAIFTTDQDSAGQGDRRQVRRPVEHRTSQRHRKTDPRCRPGPQLRPRRGRAHRTVRILRANPGDPLVRHQRLPRADVAARTAAQPWYTQKEEPAFEDMLAKLRPPSSPPDLQS